MLADIAAPHPSPLPREREPLCSAFRICVRHDGSGGAFLCGRNRSPSPQPSPEGEGVALWCFQNLCSTRWIRLGFFVRAKSQPLTPALSRGRGSRFVVLSELCSTRWIRRGFFVRAEIAAPHPSPLPREREPICGAFRICIRHDGSGRRNSKDTSVSPLSLWERVRVRAGPAESLFQLLRGLFTHATHRFLLRVDQHTGQAFLLGIK